MIKKISILLITLLTFTPLIKADNDSEAPRLCHGLSKTQEEPTLFQNIYVELFGASNLIGISYDSRIKPGSPFGYRAGISYVHGTADESINIGQSPLYYSNEELSGFAVPMEFNCILGKRKSKFEVGIGISLGIYSTQKYSYINSSAFPVESSYIIENHNQFGYFFYSNIGYRYQRKNGFMLRVGVSPSFSFAGGNGITKSPFLYPYLSLGYTFSAK